MKSKTIKIFLLLFFFGSFFTFNKFIFFPAVYQKLLDHERIKPIATSSLLRLSENDRIGDIYHKLNFMFQNNLRSQIDQNINIRWSNFYKFQDSNEGELGSRYMSWVFYSNYSSLEAIDILLNNGLTSLEILSFLKYKLGFPFFIKDELNILWDLFVNKEVFRNTLLKSDHGSTISLRLNKAKFRDMNQKYLLLIVDMAEREMFSIRLRVSLTAPLWFRELAASLSETSSYVEVSFI